MQLAHGMANPHLVRWSFGKADSRQDYLYTLVGEQLDPIVSPNKQSSHFHRILGMPCFTSGPQLIAF